jgi:hypothetical protein
LCLWYPVEFLLPRHNSPLSGCAAVRFGVLQYPKAAVSQPNEIVPAAFSILFFNPDYIGVNSGTVAEFSALCANPQDVVGYKLVVQNSGYLSF